MNSYLPTLLVLAFIIELSGCTGLKTNPENQSDIFPPEKFSVLKAELHGKPIIGSVNRAYADYKRKSEYPWCLVISIALNSDSVNSSGLPLAEESKIAYTEEDQLVDSVKKITTAHYIGHFFNDGFLDVYLYLDKPETVNSFLQKEKENPQLKRGI